MDDDEHRHLHEQGERVEGDAPPLNMKARYRRPYQTGCFGCLSRVPGCSLASWLIICIGCGSYVGGNLVLYSQIRGFMLAPFCPFLPWFVIAVAGATVILATKFLIINHCASGETSRHVLLTSGRNSCTRCCVGFVMAIAYIFQFIWTLLFTAHVILLLMLLATTIFREPTLRGCIDLRHYGVRVIAPGAIEPVDTVAATTTTQQPNAAPPSEPTTTTPVNYVTGSESTNFSTIAYRVVGTYRKSAHMCGNDLENFNERSFGFLVSVVFTLSGTFLVLVGMLNFIICLAGNYKHVKEIRHLPYMVAMPGSGDEYIVEKGCRERDVHCPMLQPE